MIIERGSVVRIHETEICIANETVDTERHVVIIVKYVTDTYEYYWTMIPIDIFDNITPFDDLVAWEKYAVIEVLLQ